MPASSFSFPSGLKLLKTWPTNGGTGTIDRWGSSANSRFPKTTDISQFQSVVRPIEQFHSLGRWSRLNFLYLSIQRWLPEDGRSTACAEIESAGSVQYIE